MRILRVVSALLVLAFPLAPLFAQVNHQTNVTLANVLVNGATVPYGRLCAVAGDQYGTPISFSSAGWGVVSASNPFCANVVNGAIAGGLLVPDAAQTNRPNPITYTFSLQLTNSTFMGQSAAITLFSAVPGVTGTTFSLDGYTPAASAVAPAASNLIGTGSSVPSSCTSPSIWIVEGTTPTVYSCNHGVYTASSTVAPSITFGTAAGTVAQGNDSRIVAALKDQGPYSGTTAYSYNDTVIVGSGPTASTYFSIVPGIQTNTGNSPATSPTQWQLLGGGGAGTPGPAGATGATGPQGASGAPGAAASIAVGTTTTASPGTPAAVANSGTSSAAVLNFLIPQGAPGATGPAGAAGAAATVSVGTTTTAAAGTPASVANSGTSQNAVFNFLIPQGPAVAFPELLTGTDANTTNTGGTAYAHIFDQSTFALPPTASGLGSQLQSQRAVTAYGPSLNLGSFNSAGGRVVSNTYLTLNDSRRGISQPFAVSASKHAVGDLNTYNYLYSSGGTNAAADEGIGLGNYTGGQISGYPHGTISSTTGTGDLQPALSITSGDAGTSDGSILLDISKGTVFGNYTGAHVQFGTTYLNMLPVSNTLPLSTAWGTLTANIANPAITPNTSATLTATITLGAIGGSSPAFTTGLACIAGPNYPEQAHITSVGAASGGTQSITFTYHNPNGYGTTYPILFQGGVCGQYISHDQNLAFSAYRTSYYAFGSTDGTHLIFGINSHGSLLSQSLPMASEAQTVTGGYHLYPGAEIVENTTAGAAPILEYNQVPWANGDTIENPPYPVISTDGLKLDLQQFTPSNNSGSQARISIVHGFGVGGINFLGYRMVNSNDKSYYTDFGGPITPPYAGFQTEGNWANGFRMGYGPSAGGSVMVIGSTEKSDSTPYNIFQQSFGTGSGNLISYNPATSTISTPNFATGSMSASSYTQAGASGCAQFASGQLSGTGTPCGSGTGSAAATSTTAGTVKLDPSQTSNVLAKVATTGAYADLSGQPTIPAGVTAPVAYGGGSYASGLTVTYSGYVYLSLQSVPAGTGPSGTGTATAYWAPIALIGPGVPVTGDIAISSSGVASLTATTNATLATLSALSLPGTQVTGTVPAATSATSATTAGNLSGTPTVPNGTSATTQVAGDATTKLATDAFATNAANVAGIPSTPAQLVAKLAASGITLSANANNALYLMQGLSGTSGTLTDQSGNGNSATWSNFVNPTFPTPQGAYFNGTAFFAMPLAVCNNAHTVMVWYRRQGNHPLNQGAMALVAPNASSFLGESESSAGGLEIGTVGAAPPQVVATSDRLSGNSSAAFTLGSPASIDVNGSPATGYIVDGNFTTMSATSSCNIGYLAGNGFVGTIYAMMPVNATLTASVRSSADRIVRQYLGTQGIAFKDEISYTSAVFVALGDSLFYNQGSLGALKTSVSYYAQQQLGGNAYTWYNLGLGADTANNMANGATRVAGWRNILQKFDGPSVLADWSGYNDVTTGVAAATILGYKQSIAQQASSASAATITNAAVIAGTVKAGGTVTGANETNRQTLNASIISSILAGTYGASGQTIGLFNPGQDPLFGYLQNVGDTTLSADTVHPTPVGNSYIAQYLACATALLSLNQPCTIGIRIPRGDLIGTSAATGSIPIFQLLPGQVVTNVAVQALSANKGTSVTAMTVSVGDTNGTTTQYAAASSVFAQAATTTNSAPTAQPTPGGVVTAYYTATGGNVNAVYTDLAVGSATNTVVSSTSHPFVALDLGTKIYISAGTGFTTGLYNVSAVCTGSGTGTGVGFAACTASGQAVLDHSPAAVSTTGGSYALGDVLIYLTVTHI